jgi:cellobiose phosphorylase
VVAAVVLVVAPQAGRGGWTWYTGSAGWMYRLIVESLLGLNLEVDRLRIRPCLPADWTVFQMHYRFRETFYHITIHSEGAGATVSRLTIDGNESADDFITLVDDRRDHEIAIEMTIAEIAVPG